MQQGILLYTENSLPDDLETWRACFQRKYKYAEQGKLARMQIPLRSICTGYLRRSVLIKA